jgi:hypothetical protein
MGFMALLPTLLITVLLQYTVDLTNYNIDSEYNSIDDSVYDSTDNSIVESSTQSIVESAPPTVESQLEFELNQFFNDNNDISMWLEQQGVHGIQEIQGVRGQGVQDQGVQDQGVQDQGVQDRRYPLRQRRPIAKAAS